jgi:membrane protease YdiL (CAAX protease family)
MTTQRPAQANGRVPVAPPGSWGPRGAGHPLVSVGLFILASLTVNLLYSWAVLALMDRTGPEGVRRLGSGKGAAASVPWDVLIVGVGFLPLALGAALLCQRYLDRLPLRLLWQPTADRRGRAFAGGLLAAAGLLSDALPGVETGRLIQHGSMLAALVVVVYALGFLLQGGIEELIFRGYVFARLGAWGGGAVALFGSALLFGVAHGCNPAGSWLPMVNTILIGLVLGLVRARHSLLTAIGLHAGWNFLLALSEIPVSGIGLPGLVRVRLGEGLLGGGDYGLEGSLPTTMVILLAVLAVCLVPAGRRLTWNGWWAPRAASHPPATDTGAGPGNGPGPDPSI